MHQHLQRIRGGIVRIAAWLSITLIDRRDVEARERVDVENDEGRIQRVVAEVVAGDPNAADELVRLISPAVARRCRSILPFPADAAEATQDALMAVLAKVSQYDGRGSFAGWVNVVAANQARMTYRSLKRRALPSEEITGSGPVDYRRVSVIAGSRVDLLEALDALEQRHPESVEAFLLRDLATLQYAEIAERLEVPLGTVKARIHTARAFMRERLAEKPLNT